MRHGLGEEIAVLDGLGDLPNYYDRNSVIDASAGANYSGGSSWPGDLPLTPSNAGLADDDLTTYYTRTGVIDASSGANYSGGSSWPGNLPLTPSNAGLAGLGAVTNAAAQAGVERMAVAALTLQQLLNMLGANIREDGVWGKASTDALVRLLMSASGEGLSREAAVFDVSKILAVARGKTVLVPTTYMAGIIRNVTRKMAAAAGGAMSGLGSADDDLTNYYTRMNVIDASSGANYSGGSSWPGNLPLTPSNAGLAGNVMYNGKNVKNMDRDYGSTIGSLEGESQHIPPYYNAGMVIDASAGANYSGGSSWPGNLPLTPSNAGLAQLSLVDPLDKVSDKAFGSRLFGSQIPAFNKVAAMGQLSKLKKAAYDARRRGDMVTAAKLGLAMKKIREMRRNIIRNSANRRKAA